VNVRVKICGMTRLEDALHAEAQGAHALGFIFYPPSPRAADPARVAEFSAKLHPFTVKVGVFVDETPEHINAIVERCRLDRIQLHGQEPFEMLKQLTRPAYRAFKLRDAGDLARVKEEPDAVAMLDTFDPALVGGTGRPFNWEWARELALEKRIILAGGLSPDNVAAAIAAARPAAVDASSSLESEPGRKDPAKVEAFFKALRGLTTQTHSGSDNDVIAV